MKRFWAGFLLGLMFVAGFALAQHLERDTPSAGGPGGQGFLGDFDSGLIVVPAGDTLLTTSTPAITSMYCHNLTGAPVSLRLRDNQATPMLYIPLTVIQGNQVVQFFNSVKGIQMKGMRIDANGTANALSCQFSGYF